MPKPKLIKVREDLYNWIRYIGERDFGKGYSMPYYLYKIAKSYNNGKMRKMGRK